MVSYSRATSRKVSDASIGRSSPGTRGDGRGTTAQYNGRTERRRNSMARGGTPRNWPSSPETVGRPATGLYVGKPVRGRHDIRAPAVLCGPPPVDETRRDGHPAILELACDCVDAHITLLAPPASRGLS